MELKDKLALTGLNLVDQPEKPLLNLYGIEDLKELALPVCKVANNIINKKSLPANLGIVMDLPAAISGIENVGKEILDMSPDEFIAFSNFIKDNIKFEGDAHKYEEIVEDITVHVLGLALCIIRAMRLKDDNKE